MGRIAKHRLFGTTAFWCLFAALALLAITWGLAYARSIEQFNTGSVLWGLAGNLLQSSWFWWQALRYLLTLLLLYFVFFYLLAQIARVLFAEPKPIVGAVILWLIGILCLRLFNSGFFPHSALAFGLPHVWFVDRLLPVAAGVILGVLLLLGAIHVWFRGLRRWHLNWLVASLVIVGAWFGLVGFGALTGGPQRQLAANRPNIILIGVDGLRPDQLQYMHTQDPDFKNLMPFLDRQLSHSVIFTQAYTSVARTYPSWMGILTGQSPLHSGVRFDLQNDYGWWEGQDITLPAYFNGLGYQSAWAIDDTTFCNIGTRQGFQTALAPEPGAAAMLIIQVLSDLPIVNALSNMAVGRYLLPVVYANRARGFAYYPTTFSRWLDSYVRHSNRDKPLFLAVHFTLPHHPLIYADDGVPQAVATIHNHLNILKQYYRQTLAAADGQIRALMAALQKDGRLDNAVVFFLSDHGNGLHTGMMNKNRVGKSVYAGDTTIGHGTDVLNLDQQHALLAVRGFGSQVFPPAYRDGIVSLMDIAPTLLGGFGLKPNAPMQGRILNIYGTAPQRRRVVYFETGTSAAGLMSANLDIASLVAAKAKTYRILANGRLVQRNDLLPALYKAKIRSAFDGQYLLGRAWEDKAKIMRSGARRYRDGKLFGLNRDTFASHPDLRQLARDFCRHYADNDAYFTRPRFCLVAAHAP